MSDNMTKRVTELTSTVEEALEWCLIDATNEDGYPTQEMLDNRVEVLTEALEPSSLRERAAERGPLGEGFIGAFPDLPDALTTGFSHNVKPTDDQRLSWASGKCDEAMAIIKEHAARDLLPNELAGVYTILHNIKKAVTK